MQRGEGVRLFYAHYSLVALELGLGRCHAVLDAAKPFEEDIGFLATRILPNVIEAAVGCGQDELARSALDRLRQPAEASGTPWL